MPHDLRDVKFWGRQVDLPLQMIHALAIHGALCLALRHPDIGSHVAPFLREIVAALERLLQEASAISAEDVAAAHALEHEILTRRLQ